MTRRLAHLAPLLAPALGLLVACGGSTRDTSDFGDGGTSGAGGGSDDPGSGAFADAGTSGAADDGCSDASRLVYVVTAESDLYSFRPDTLTFTRIGTVDCPSPGRDAQGQTATPNSMAVDRSGVAWVNFSSGKLFKVSTADASCQATSFQPGQSNFGKFGMAFSSNAAGSKDETLYVAGFVDDVLTGGEQGLGLATIDLGTLKLTTIGDFTQGLGGQAAELTGTGDAKLYGFFTSGPTTPSTLAEITKGSGTTPSASQVRPNGVQSGNAWAFSFWGGDFWFYTAAPNETSKVTRYKTSSDHSTSVVLSDLGYRIVGAGVSTCAPTAPPK